MITAPVHKEWLKAMLTKKNEGVHNKGYFLHKLRTLIINTLGHEGWTDN